jgi:hypothetical protein
MTDVLRIKRRVSGGAGAPSGLANAELAYNEVDHILYYGEGTGGSGGSASVIAAIAGQGLAYNSNPTMNGSVAAGAASLWARGDHVHPVDTSRASVASVPLAQTDLPLVDSGTGVTGTGTTYARNDHRHPIDLTRAPLDNPVFTGDARLTTSPVNTDNDKSIASTEFVKGQRLDQFALPTATVNMNGQIVSNVQQGTAGTDVATRAYVDANSAGLVAHTAVAAATVANITLSGAQTIDGVAVTTSNRVLVKDQAAAQTNGIYVVQTGAWSRAADMDVWTEVPQAYVLVSNGTVNAASGWVCNSSPGGTLETTPITWQQFSQQTQVTAGAGLTRTGNQFDVVGVANQIIVNADDIGIHSGYVGQSSITTLGTIAGSAVWNATTIAMGKGGTGATSIASGYVTSNGSLLSSVSTIPNTAINGLGTMSTQAANNVAITGGTIENVVFDMGTF